MSKYGYNNRGAPIPSFKPGLENTGKIWTPDEDQELFRTLKEGMSLDEIAKLHKRTPVAIKMRLEGLVWDLHRQSMSPEEIQKRVPLSFNDIKTIITNMTSKEASKPTSQADIKLRLDAIDTKLDTLIKLMSK